MQKQRLLEYHHLIKRPQYKDKWGYLFGNTIGRLAEGTPGTNNGTDTLCFNERKEVPEDRWNDVTCQIVWNILLGESKYGPESGPQWTDGGNSYRNLYTALLEELFRMRRTMLLVDNSRAKKVNGRIMRRPAHARTRNQ